MTHERLSDLDDGNYPPSWVYDELVERFEGKLPPLAEFVAAAQELAKQRGAMCAGAAPMEAGTTTEAPMYDLRFYLPMNDAESAAGVAVPVPEAGTGYYDHVVCVICAPGPEQRVVSIGFES